MIQWPDKLLFVPSTGEWRHYQLERDPGEMLPEPLPPTQEIVKLQRTASELWERGAAKAAPEPVRMDDQTRDALHGLGYIE